MRSLLFDLDGTLTDPFEGITKSLCEAAARMGRVPPAQEDLRWCIGPPMHACLSQILGTDDDEEIARCLALFRERFSTIGIYENTPYPGVREALDLLRAEGWTLFVATSKPVVFARRVLAHFELDSAFQAIYGSELNGDRSGKDEVIAHLLETEGLSPESAIMIGDRKHDVVGAHAHGLPCIGVLWGYGDRVELEAAGAAALCASFEELPGTIAALALVAVETDAPLSI